MINQVSDATRRESNLADLTQGIRDHLNQVEEILQVELRSDIDAVSEMLQHPMFRGGKRIRPILLLLAGKACGNLQSKHHLLAAVIEMIHAATLVHDDILDGAKTRRHAQTINEIWGTQLAVLLGDFLFSHAFYLASTTGSTQACQMIGQSTNAVCAGEMFQIVNQGNTALSEQEYLKMIDGKTASLCGCACSLGAICSDRSEREAELFYDVGLKYGRAFQVIDDILDLRGIEQEVGKSLGTDLKQLKLTLPLIQALSQCNEQQREQWLQRLDSNDFETVKLVAMVSEFGGFEYALKFAHSEIRQAEEILTRQLGLPTSDDLVELGSFILSRQQ